VKRDDYRAIKRMNRLELEAYLKRLYQRGYENGLKAMAKQTGKDTDAKTKE